MTITGQPGNARQRGLGAARPLHRDTAAPPTRQRVGWIAGPHRRGALVLGDHRHSLAVARSLHGAGYRIIAGRVGERSILERSRCVSEVWIHPPLTEPAAWQRALEAFCSRRPDVGLVFPVGAHEIELAQPLAARLPALLVAVAPAASAVCRSKRALLTLAERAGVPTGPWEAVGSFAELLPVLERVGLPAVLKPDLQADDMLGGKAAIICGIPDVLRLAGRNVPRECSFVLQRLAPGTRHNFYFVAHEGRLLGQAQLRITRTDRPDGTGLAVEGRSVAPAAELLAWTSALAGHLNYSGAGCAQFMVDERTGCACFLEINSRLGANCAAVCACGLDLPRLFVEALLGRAVEQPAAAVGRRYAWLEGDLHGLVSCLKSGRLSGAEALAWLARAAYAQLRAHDQITFSWRDPMPTLAILDGYRKAALERALGWLRPR
ncbi:MAG: hypothetical protein ACREQZ_06355 [Woeseiaceae bacterium]